MKTKIVGWIYIVGSAFFIFWGLVSFLTIGDTFVNPTKSLILTVATIGLGVYAFTLGSAIKNHKIWSYKIGLITLVIAGIGNLIGVLFGNYYLIIPTLFNAFGMYALLNEKNLFL